MQNGKAAARSGDETPVSVFRGTTLGIGSDAYSDIHSPFSTEKVANEWE